MGARTWSPLTWVDRTWTADTWAPPSGETSEVRLTHYNSWIDVGNPIGVAVQQKVCSVDAHGGAAFNGNGPTKIQSGYSADAVKRHMPRQMIVIRLLGLNLLVERLKLLEPTGW